MNCPECYKMVVDVAEHCIECDVAPERFHAIGVISVEELEVINNRNKPKGASTPLDSKH